jgi:hypothetical protein
MTSEELNNKIKGICDDITHYDAFGHKSIPYIGWFWRNVHFDSEGCYFGILPGGEVGFMENNKWGYEERYCTGDDWKEVKVLLIEAVTTPGRETLEAVDSRIQSFFRKSERSR